LDAARAADVDVPTLCEYAGHEAFTSCMVCLVEDRRSGHLLPACSAPAEAGMRIVCDSDSVKLARRTALEMLLSEHVGDCEAPCRRACPRGVDIPMLLRKIQAGESLGDAEIPCAGCDAPCEKACRRAQVDAAVAIHATLGNPSSPEATAGGERNMQHSTADTQQPRGAMARVRTDSVSVTGKMLEGEAEEYLKEASVEGRVSDGDIERGLSAEMAKREAARCLHCDCRAPVSCKLRRYAEAYGAKQGSWRPTPRVRVSRDLTQGAVVYESGKCIRCGLCVRVCRAAGEPVGLSFVGRGYDMRIGPPQGYGMTEALGSSAQACVKACPTGALAYCRQDER
jgi:predicted molibdopterin-dependent oxidoreductase YjgC